ncbi:xanthan lyase [Abditibacteriota bacterium]|nr:xanthan lyase [Abditibacteriota bacterium]
MPNHYSRRDFLALSGVSALTLAWLTGCAHATPTAEPWATVSPEIFATMRARWRALFISGTQNKAPHPPTRLTRNAIKWRDSMNMVPTRTALWESGGSAAMTGSFSHLHDMALAYATPNQPLYGDEKLLSQTLVGLDWMTSQWYAPGKKETDNWWDWEIGSPQLLTDTAIILYNRLSPAQRAAYAASVTAFIPDPTRRNNLKNFSETGANRSDKCQAIAIAALLTDDARRLAEARDGLSQIFHYVTSGDGYYADGSFIQHTDIPYTGTYGVVLLGGLARLFALFMDTPWEVVDPNRKIVFEAVEKSYAPFIFNGLMMDGVCGRAVTRSGSRDSGHGRSAMNEILQLSDGAPPEYAADYRARVKGWLLRSNQTDFGGAQKILRDPSIVAKPEPINHQLFADMDRAIHRRPGWALEISMCSTRIARYEGTIHKENTRGWYQSDGMTYLYLDNDLSHFNADYWPTVNPYRLPGTTVDTSPRIESSGTARPKTARFVGGAVLNNLYGAVAQELEGFDSTLRAQKSWFCLDDAIVCLGAGITSTDDRTIETIVENRNLHKEGATWLVNNSKMQEKVGEATVEKVAFAHLEGVGGYLFPGSPTLRAVRETREGVWAGAPEGVTVSRPYLTFWFDHGPSPANATYAYVLLPKATAETTQKRAQAPGFEIMSNTESVQAIRAGNLVLANFWTAGKLGDIEVFAPCSLIIERKNGVLNIAVAHPSRTTGMVKVQIAGSVKKKLSGDETVSLMQNAPNTIIEVKNAESRGHTHSARFEV